MRARSSEIECRTEVQGDQGVVVLRVVRHTGFRELYLTAWSPRSGKPASAAEASRHLFGHVAALLARERVQPIS